jgi:hypothetical protein
MSHAKEKLLNAHESREEHTHNLLLKKISIHHDSHKKIIVSSEQQNTSAMHILYYLAGSKDVKRPT